MMRHQDTRRASRARINPVLPAIILFGIAITVGALVFFLEGKGPDVHEGLALNSRQSDAQSPAQVDVSSNAAKTIAEAPEIRKERIESSQNGAGNRLAGDVALRGRVLERDTLKPLAGVAIHIQKAEERERNPSERRERPPQAITDEDGVYALEDLKPGPVDIFAILPGYAEGFAKDVEVLSGATAGPVEILLDPGSTIKGRVFLEGQGMAGIRVTASLREPEQKISAITDSKGFYEIRGLSEGKYSIFASLGHYKQNLTEVKEYVRTIRGAAVECDLQFVGEGDHYLAGVVRNDIGEAVADVEITVYQSSNKNRLTRIVRTGEDGTFRVTGLSKVLSEIHVYSERGYWDNRMYEITPDRGNLEFKLMRYARLKGRVVDSSGTDVQSFSVYGRSFSNGTFDLERIMPGEKIIVITTSEGNVTESAPLTLEPGEVREGITITLQDMGTLTGRVLDRDSLKPVAGVSIEAREQIQAKSLGDSLQKRRPQSTTDEDGAYTLENLKPGLVDIIAIHPDYIDGSRKNVEVVSGMTAGPVEILLEPGGMVLGRVFLDGRGMADIEVKASRREPPQRKGAVTDSEGFYEIRSLSEGEYWIRARMKQNKQNWTVQKYVRTSKGSSEKCDLHFEQGAAITGTVYVLGKPTGGVYLTMRSDQGSGEVIGVQSTYSTGTETAPDGTYKIYGLSQGRYRLSASLPRTLGRSFRYEQEIDVQPGVKVIDIRMGGEGVGEVFGYVYENDQPAKGVRVFVGVEAEGFGASCITDEQGAYRVKEVPAGKAHVGGSMQKGRNESTFSSSSEEFIMKEGDCLRKDLHFTTGSGEVFGSVTCNGDKMTDFSMYLKGEPDNGLPMMTAFFSARAAAEGEYRFENLPAGRYDIYLGRPKHMWRIVRVKEGESRRIDFSFEMGTGSVQGMVKYPADGEDPGSARVYLFTPEMCPWKAGQAFDLPTSDKGLYVTIPVNPEGRFSYDKLPSGAFDVVAVHKKDEKILNLDIKRITLGEGESRNVDLDVSKE